MRTKPKKSKWIDVPIKIEAQQLISKTALKSMRAAIDSGEAPLVFEFRDGTVCVDFFVYPEDADGKFELALKGDTLQVDADFRYSLEVNEYMLSLTLPAALYLAYTVDGDADNHYFNDAGILLDFVLSSIP